MSFFKNVQDHPITYGALAASTVTGMGAASHQFRKDSGLEAQDRLEHTGMAGMRGFVGGAAVVGLGASAYHFRDPLRSAGQKAVGFLGKHAKNAYNQSVTDYTLLSALVPKDAAHKLAIESRGASVLTKNQAFTRAALSNSRLLVGGGAAIGAAIGAANGDPVTGAAVGATAGLAARMAYGATDAWKKAGKIPLLRSAGVVGLSTMIFVGTQAMVDGEFAGEAGAIPDGMGGYEYGEPGGLKSRMSAMNATGDLVLGLNNARHGK
jgi:hypothetical protein